MYLDRVQTPAVQQTVNISAKLIASIKILQCSAEELEQTIARELSENPALEVEELAQCLRCGTPLHAGVCPSCERATSDGPGDPREDLASWDDVAFRGTDLAVSEDSDYDPLESVRSAGTLQEYLMRQLRTIIASEDVEIAEYLVGNLNSHGYVAVSVAEAAATLRVVERRVETVLEALQSLDPPGIGARDLRECLLIQLAGFEERGEAPPLARRVVAEHLRAMGEHHFAEIARDLGTTASQVKLAWRFIKSNLNPYPAHAFECAEVPDLGLSLASDRSTIVRPDVVIRETPQGFEAEIIEQRRFRFHLSGIYSSLYQPHQRTVTRLADLDDRDRQHVREYASRARFFIECMRQRWDTLSTIAGALIASQQEFLKHGVRHLKPLTRGELAEAVGLHESTVSRATANKYVLLPSGRTIPFDDFFDGSLAAKDMLRELIANENSRKPLSDEDLASRLAERGLVVARRTVAKYREALGILPSRLRI